MWQGYLYICNILMLVAGTTLCTLSIQALATKLNGLKNPLKLVKG